MTYYQGAWDEEPATAWDIAVEQGWDQPTGDDHGTHDQDGWYRCCGMTREQVLAEREEVARLDAADAARRAADELAEAAAIAAGDLPW